MRFDNSKFRSLNETITHMNEPQVNVDEYGDKEPKGREGKYDFHYTRPEAHDKIMKQVEKAAEARKKSKP